MPINHGPTGISTTTGIVPRRRTAATISSTRNSTGTTNQQHAPERWTGPLPRAATHRGGGSRDAPRGTATRAWTSLSVKNEARSRPRVEVSTRSSPTLSPGLEHRPGPPPGSASIGDVPTKVGVDVDSSPAHDVAAQTPRNRPIGDISHHSPRQAPHRGRTAPTTLRATARREGRGHTRADLGRDRDGLPPGETCRVPPAGEDTAELHHPFGVAPPRHRQTHPDQEKRRIAGGAKIIHRTDISWEHNKLPARERSMASPIAWAYVVSNHGPLPCEGSALPLSYTPLPVGPPYTPGIRADEGGRQRGVDGRMGRCPPSCPVAGLGQVRRDWPWLGRVPMGKAHGGTALAG